MQLKTLIVDDEPLAREGLRALLSRDPEISAIHEAKDGRDAVAVIREHKPDLVFLDVQMPEMDGFTVVRAIGVEEMPVVVFVTAHDKYAMQAFECSALDYLLKPVMEDRFAKAITRAKKQIRFHAEDSKTQLIALLESLASPRSFLRRLASRSAGRTVLIDVADVDWIQGAENYVELHVGQQSYLVHVTMSALEKSLNPENFLRIHRSIIVNIDRIKDLQPGDHGDYMITLRNGLRLQAGPTYAPRVKALITNRF